MPDRVLQAASVSSPADSGDSLPEVRLEVRPGTGKAATYTVTDASFLIGSVPGCDLRVPGANLPAVLCLISRRPEGATLRKLAPTQVVQVNGQAAANSTLTDGDRITVGSAEIVVHVRSQETAETVQKRPRASTSAAEDSKDSLPASLAAAQKELQKQLQEFRAQVVRFQEERDTAAADQERRDRELDERALKLRALEQQLAEQTAELEADRAVWYQKREEIERDCFQKQRAESERKAEEAAAQLVDLQEREKAVARHAEELARQQANVDERTAEVAKQKQELAAGRQELADIRRQLYERYQERRDRLAGLQEAVTKAARKVQENKRQLEAEIQAAATGRAEDEGRQAELQARTTEIAELMQRMDEERRLFQEHQSRLNQELETRWTDLRAREDKLTSDSRDLSDRQKQHQDDLVRLDRLQGTLDERDRQLHKKAEEIDRRFQELKRDSAEMEEQVVQFDELRTRLTQEASRLDRQKAEQEETAAQLTQRAAALEGQQATVAALRTRLERMKEELRREEQQLAEQRVRQEEVEKELQQHLQESLRLRAELDGEQALREQERQKLVERQATLDAAVSQLRQEHDKLAAEESRLRQYAADLDSRSAEHGEKAAQLQGRLDQLEEAQQRLDEERQTLRDRTQALAQAEQTREALQEQLRRRSEELAARQKGLAEQVQKYEAETASVEARRAEVELQRQQAQEQAALWQQEHQAQAAALEKRRADLQQQQDDLERRFQTVKETGQQVAAERKALGQERAQADAERQDLAQIQARQRAEFEALRREASELAQQLPDIELRAGTALERLTHAREQLKEHLAEVHAYARQCQEDLEALRGQLQAEAERLARQELAQRRQHDEHRLAVAGFRQQLIDWQGQIADMKRVLTQDGTRLERRQAKVDEQARQIDETSQRLAAQAAELEEQERAVADRRQEVEGHLADMREWYRKKLRELALGPSPQREQGEANTASATDDVETQSPERNILALTGPVDESDRRLGELLAELELIEPDSLTALLAEARRQRRSLRQVLLTSGTVTLYQMALIEAGNVDALMLGPVRVVDRLRSSPRETAYRVFDPRRGQEAVLRHLAEAEMHDAVRPDEFRQRFRQAVLSHPNLAGTLEVLEIQGRPGALQELLVGLPSTDWPPLAAVPGVCFRLLNQAALGLHTAHQAGLVHGRLQEGSLLLTAEGELKVCGLGEPPWLSGSASVEDEASPAADLRALGKIVSGWCSPAGVRRGAKTKPLPEAFVGILFKLNSESEGYASAEALLEDLDRAGADVPGNTEAWDRLLRHVRDNASAGAALRQSA
jgi:chromosome segregation ATPase